MCTSTEPFWCHTINIDMYKVLIMYNNGCSCDGAACIHDTFCDPPADQWEMWLLPEGRTLPGFYSAFCTLPCFLKKQKQMLLCRTSAVLTSRVERDITPLLCELFSCSLLTGRACTWISSFSLSWELLPLSPNKKQTAATRPVLCENKIQGSSWEYEQIEQEIRQMHFK